MESNNDIVKKYLLGTWYSNNEKYQEIEIIDPTGEDDNRYLFKYRPPFINKKEEQIKQEIVNLHIDKGIISFEFVFLDFVFLQNITEHQFSLIGGKDTTTGKRKVMILKRKIPKEEYPL